MDPTDEPFAPAPGEENRPDHAMSPPAPSSGLERLLLVLAVLSAALVFLPLTAETALLHWNIIGAEHEFIVPLRKAGLLSCLACMAASWLLEKEKEEGGHQAIVFGLLAGLLLIADWGIETLVPFEGWWQALRLTPPVVYGGLAYAFLAERSGRGRGAPPDDEVA
jgi:hypothetical protein